MKKILKLFLFTSIILSLTACGTKEESVKTKTGIKESDSEMEVIEDIDQDEDAGNITTEDVEKIEETEDVSKTDKEDEGEGDVTKSDDTNKNDKSVTKAPTPTKAPTNTPTPTKAATKSPTKAPYKKVSDTRYASASVNVRSGPGTNYEVLGKLTRGQKITRIGVTDNGWGVFKYKDQDGYVSGNYLVTSKPAAPTPKPTQKPSPSKPSSSKPSSTPSPKNPHRNENGSPVNYSFPDHLPLFVPEGTKLIKSGVDDLNNDYHVYSYHHKLSNGGHISEVLIYPYVEDRVSIRGYDKSGKIIMIDAYRNGLSYSNFMSEFYFSLKAEDKRVLIDLGELFLNAYDMN